MNFNKNYLSSNHGLCRILHIIIGFIVSSLLCANWYNGRSCFSEKVIAVAAGINMLLVFLNIVVFVCNFINFGRRSLELYYSVVCVILYVVGTGLLCYYMAIYRRQQVWLSISVILFVLNILLAIFDVKILRGDIQDD